MNAKVVGGLKQSIQASFAAIDSFCAQIKKILIDADLDKHNYEVQLLLREALTNAVQHGCRCDSAKTIECEFLIEQNMFIIVVSDDGDGFDWKAASEKEVDTESTSGRGLNILKIYANDIIFNQKGNKIIIKRNIQRGEESNA
ncbi:MAG: ATP-binding protein [bacterium]